MYATLNKRDNWDSLWNDKSVFSADKNIISDLLFAIVKRTNLSMFAEPWSELIPKSELIWRIESSSILFLILKFSFCWN